tara:strand:+ start:150 stop:404 length:255 start_codon:yes stop_codon:yes gene_type:complete
MDRYVEAEYVHDIAWDLKELAEDDGYQLENIVSSVVLKHGRIEITYDDGHKEIHEGDLPSFKYHKQVTYFDEDYKYLHNGEDYE